MVSLPPHSPLPFPPNFDAVGLRIKLTVTFRTTVVKEEKGTITSSEGAERNQYHRCIVLYVNALRPSPPFPPPHPQHPSIEVQILVLPGEQCLGGQEGGSSEPSPQSSSPSHRHKRGMHMLFAQTKSLLVQLSKQVLPSLAK